MNRYVTCAYSSELVQHITRALCMLQVVVDVRELNAFQAAPHSRA
jgi:hypothetical protein